MEGEMKMEHELNKNGVASVSGIINSNYDIGSIVAIVQAVNHNAEVLSELIDRLPKEKTTVHDDTAIEAANVIKSYCKSKSNSCDECIFYGANNGCLVLRFPSDWNLDENEK
jgi:hypothetical protein